MWRRYQPWDLAIELNQGSSLAPVSWRKEPQVCIIMRVRHTSQGAETRPFRQHRLPTMRAQSCLTLSLCGHARKWRKTRGQLFTERPCRTLNLSSESSRVRGLPVARSVSGSNHILKGILTRNTTMKKFIAPVALGSRFSWVVLYALSLRI